MVKKLILILLISLIVGLADTHLVRVELNEDRLLPLVDEGLTIIGELESAALVLVETADFDKLSSFSFRTLDTEPQDGRYYLVRPLDSEIDLSIYGTILTKDGTDYLIKIEEDMLEPLIREKVMVKRLLLTPLILKSESAPQLFMSNVAVQEIVGQIHPDSVLSHVQRLQDFWSRYSTFDSCFAAAAYIGDKFIDYGCDSVYFQDHVPGHAPNVIAIKRGALYPDSIYTVICGHFDAISDQAPWIAPGADDNASGTAGVIEAARVMKDYDFEYSVRYIAFSGEEFGLYGSHNYATEARARGDSILGVFNADMIAYVDAQPESLEVIAKISNPACEPLADFFIAAADTYTSILTRKNMVNFAPYSDHSPFWDNGYVALCSIEDNPPVNPHYHLTSDTIGAGYNDNDFCTEVIKAHVAALSLMAVPYETGVDEITNTTAKGFRLRVYPTIGNSRFSISFEILSPEDNSSLAIYDVTGKRVKNYDLEPIVAHSLSQVLWDCTDTHGKNLPAGIYFVELENDGLTETEKLILFR